MTIDYNAYANLPALYFEKAAENGSRNFLWVKRAETYHPITWEACTRDIKALSLGLRQLGLARGERVVVLSENRPEWLISDLAIMSAGGITVPAYTTNMTNDHLHVLSHSGAVGVIVSTRALAQRLLPAAMQSQDCRWIIALEEFEAGQTGELQLFAWSDVIASGAEQPDDVEDYARAAGRDDVACFIYTSGTGGVPKAVMSTHGGILANCHGAHRLLQDFGLGDEIFLSFLPLSHSYEHTAGQFFPISLSAQIYYAESVDQLLKNLAEVRPTVMTAVPRLYESMYQRLSRQLQKEKPFKQRLFAKTEALGRKKAHEGGRLNLIESLQDAVLDRLVRNKVRARFGGRLKAMVSGGAALNPDIGLYFTALGLRILQGYGQTEASPVISANPPARIKMETVGPALDGVEVKIAGDGEILVRGELLMKGYWQDEEATDSTIVDGWLHTGDIGEMDGDGYIKITDRKKDIIVLSGGDNVSPARVESFLTLQTEIEQAMVIGDKRPHLVAILVPDKDFLRDWCKANGKSHALSDLTDDADLKALLKAAVERVNEDLPPLEKVRRFMIAPEGFTTENEMATPTLKIRRHKIKAVYGEALEGLYGKAS
ncbi:MAG: long-chain fatty acid--CoA ligase [Pseudomonadota bacterium]